MHVDIIWLNGTSDAEYISVILYCDPKTAASMACHTTCPTKLSATPKRPLSDSEVGSRRACEVAKYGQGWIRTSEGVKPADLQSAPFGRFGTYPL